METRANFVLIGAFTLAGFAVLLLFLMWFARIELDRQYDYYDTDFPSVSGLSSASSVRFAGLPVGQVVDVSLSPDQSGRVRVRIEVAADTPVRTSSVATIESQGVTGVSYVGLSAGDPRDPLLSATSADQVPQIPAGRSALQTLTEGAPRSSTNCFRCRDNWAKSWAPRTRGGSRPPWPISRRLRANLAGRWKASRPCPRRSPHRPRRSPASPAGWKGWPSPPRRRWLR
ncbi:MAG: MCE family protein [Rhodobacteraceae bacterium]|nr:MCE family protein [Paracoccaceae bacterium]